LVKNKEDTIKKINSSYKPRKVVTNGEIIEEPERYNNGILVGIPENNNFLLIVQSFKLKLSKLNGDGYKKFENNYLFVFSSILADEKMIMDATIEMIDYQNDFDIKFNKVIVSVPEQIYICDLNKKRCEIIDIKEKEFNFAMQARDYVIQGELE